MPVVSTLQPSALLSSSTSTGTMHVDVHFSATDFLEVAEAWLVRREREANCILPRAQAYRDIEIGHDASQRDSKPYWSRVLPLLKPETRDHVEEVERISESRQFWMTVWFKDSSLPASSPPTLDLVLACTASHIDNLPIFLWSSLETSTITSEWLESRMSLLITRLADIVVPTRVFSVFAPNRLTESFSAMWSSRTGMATVKTPYYSASLSYLTRETLTVEDTTRTPSLTPLPSTLRQARRSDIPAVAEHCYEFAFDSDFPIDRKGALREATHYINSKQMWVCAVEGAEGQTEIASIVAVTRNTRLNATITKVHTAAAHRKRGYAETLVRHVCETLLFDDNIVRRHALDYSGPYDSIALYVAHDNIAAATVYKRVGFAGLLGAKKPAGVEDVLELGFVGATKGYW